MEARYERKFEEQQKEFAMIVEECKRMDDAPTTRRRAAAQILVADTSNDESDDDSDDESVVVETNTSRTRRIARERSAAVAKRDAERVKADKKANKAAKKKADKALTVAEEKKSWKKQKKKKSRKAKLFADGDSNYEPGMQYPTKDDYPDDDYKALRTARDKFYSARGRHHNSGTKAAKADKIKTIKENLARAEAMEVTEEE